MRFTAWYTYCVGECIELSQVILPVKRDIIFKIFFADERNIEFLTDFLKSALSIPAEEYDEVLIVDPHYGVY